MPQVLLILKRRWFAALAFLLGLAAADTAAQAEKEVGVTVWKAREHTPFPFSIIGHSEWKPVTIEIHSTLQAGPVRVEGKISSWTLKISWPAYLDHRGFKDTNTTAVLGFTAPRGDIWVGSEKEFYVESLAGVLGGEYRSGRLYWFESMVVRKGQDKTTLDDCLKLFEREIDGNTLELFNSDMGVAPDGELTPCRLSRVTELRPPLDPEILGNLALPPNTPTADIHVTGVQVTGNTLRLDLKSRRDVLFRLNEAVLNPSRLPSLPAKEWKGQYVASVWIDIPSKEVIKAEENGRYTWPR